MSVDNDPFAKQVNPEVLQQLLHRFDWTLASVANDAYDVWLHEGKPDVELLFPKDSRRGDYSYLLARVYRSLMNQYGSDVSRQAALISFQMRSMLDATRWEKETNLETGMIQWDIGQDLHIVARTNLAIAAKAAHKPRPYYGNNSPYISKKFIDATLMGQTELGSYVVTAYTPSGERFFVSRSSEEASSSKMVDVESKSGAEIIDKLDEIIGSVRGKLDEYRKDARTEIFNEILPTGFSFEIATSLAMLSDQGEGAVKVTRANPRGGRDVTSEYTFSPTEASVLQRVGESLKRSAEPETVNLVGEVTLLEHISNVDEHTVRLHVANQPGIRTVRMNLSPEQYDVALEAHRNDEQLRVRGTVERQGRFNWLTDPSNVAVAAGVGNDEDAADSPAPEEVSPVDDIQSPLF